MKTTLNWLRYHINENLSLSEVISALNNLSMEIDDVMKIGGEGFIPVKIIETKPHGDRLNICTVNYSIDNEVYHQDVVCGASNAKKGTYALLAKEGTTLFNGITIKPRNIRGFLSKGMLLSYEELGLTHMKSDGIMESDKEAYIRHMGEEDYILTLSLPANRIDLNSSRGIAQELACYLNIPIRDLLSSSEITHNNNIRLVAHEETTVALSTLVIQNATYKENYPLVLSFLCKISNISSMPIINICNFITFDLGIPLHVYNKKDLEELRVVLLRTEKEITTLDGQKVILQPNDIVTTNEKDEILTIGGIIGVNDYKVSNSHVVIEAAIFNRAYLVPSARRLNIQTTAAKYFTRGINYHHYLMVMEYVKCFIKGEFSQVRMINHDNHQQQKIFLSYHHFYRVCHISISLDKISALLQQYKYITKIAYERQDGLNNEVGIELQPPLWKSHINSAAAVIEDIIRVGQLTINKEHLLINYQNTSCNILYDNIYILKQYLISNSFKEVITSSFVATPCPSSIEIGNPILQKEKYLRHSLKEHMLLHLELMEDKKLGVEYKDRIFEIGKVFSFSPHDREIIVEETNLMLGFLRNPHIYASVSLEMEIKNVLYALEELFPCECTIQVSITSSNIMQLYISNETHRIEGSIEFFHKYITCEICNLELLLNKPSTMNSYRTTSVPRDFLIRDYSFKTNKSYKEIETSLSKVKDISFSLFDRYEDSYGIRIKFFDTNEQKQKEVLNLLEKLEVSLR